MAKDNAMEPSPPMLLSTTRESTAVTSCITIRPRMICPW